MRFSANISRNTHSSAISTCGQLHENFRPIEYAWWGLSRIFRFPAITIFSNGIFLFSFFPEFSKIVPLIIWYWTKASIQTWNICTKTFYKNTRNTDDFLEKNVLENRFPYFLGYSRELKHFFSKIFSGKNMASCFYQYLPTISEGIFNVPRLFRYSFVSGMVLWICLDWSSYSSVMVSFLCLWM